MSSESKEETLPPLELEGSPLSVLVLSTDGRVQTSNAAARSFFCIDDESSWNIFDHARFEDDRFARHFQRVTQSRGTDITEGMYRRPDGETYIRLYLSARPDDKVLCLAVDLTALYGTEQRFLHLYDYFNGIVSSISPLVTFDADYRIRFMNEPFRQLFPETESHTPSETLFRYFVFSGDQREQFQKNIEESTHRQIENARFRIRDRTYGYTVFRFADEAGIILKDITRVVALEHHVENLHTELLTTQERERQRIASELHDGVAQTILAAKLNITAFAKDGERSRLERGLELIDLASEELRDLYSTLYPSVLRDLGLESAIRWCARNVLETSRIDFALDADEDFALPEYATTQLYRIAQELFSNITRHAQARSVQVRLSVSGNNRILTVQDDGRGFSPDNQSKEPRGFGWTNIRRRVTDLGGRVEVESRPGSGTTVRIVIPTSTRGDVG